MKKMITALLLLGASLGLATTAAQAQTDTETSKAKAKSTSRTSAKKTKKTTAKKTTAAAAAGAAAAGAGTAAAAGNDDDDRAPELAGAQTVEYDCALGDKVTLYENAADTKYIGLRWKQTVHRLTRVDTTTGAKRYENRKIGLVWIGIPAKGMLLDSKKGQQLANECRNAEQMKSSALPAGVPALASLQAVAQY